MENPLHQNNLPVTTESKYKCRKKENLPGTDPAESVRSMLSIRRCIDFNTEFNAFTRFLTPEILVACCIMKGDGASSSNLSSSEN